MWDEHGSRMFAISPSIRDPLYILTVTLLIQLVWGMNTGSSRLESIYQLAIKSCQSGSMRDKHIFSTFAFQSTSQ